MSHTHFYFGIKPISGFLLVSVSLLLLSLTSCSKEVSKSQRSKNIKSDVHWVETYLVQPSRISITKMRTGSTKAPVSVDIYTQEEGQIIELPFYEGDTVKKGEIIARLDDALLQAQLERATALRTQVEMDLKRLRTLSEKQLASADGVGLKETELAVALSDERVLQTRITYTVLRSPISGTVISRLSEAGNIAGKHSHLLTIADLGSMVTEMNVSELLMPRIRKMDEVSLQFDALNMTLIGKVSRIFPNINPLTRSGIIEVAFSNPEGKVLPGQFVRGTFVFPPEESLFIPFRAIQRDQANTYVWVLGGESKVDRRQITTGLQNEDQIEVTAGLKKGELIITRGFLELKSGKQVTPVNSHE